VDVSTYTGNDGMVHANLEVTANEVEFLTPRDAQGAAPASGQGNPAPAYQAPAAAAPAAPATPAGFTAVETDELPF